METIRLYNTLDREKVELKPIEPGKIRMYVCGPTVYDRCHIGHARPAVCFDTIRRYLEYAGYTVNFIANITDIDDKIIARASERNIPFSTLAQRYQDEYEQDMSRLGVRSPSIRPKATEHIPEMVNLIQILLDKGVAYRNDRGVWFDISRYPGYGKLSGRRMDDEHTEHRVEEDPDKRNPQDFALWKTSRPGEPVWETPFGAGRPGWHIECSAMSGRYCDFQLDIHGGGADLAFPHHENELAQSEAATGKEFVRYWMHNGFITVAKENGEETKMGKSRGNAFWLREVFDLYPPAALRFWILGTSYRIPLTYSKDCLAMAMNGLDRIYNCLESVERVLGREGLAAARKGLSEADSTTSVQLDRKFRDAMNDDFNTAQALAVVFETISLLNSLLKEREGASPSAALFTLLETHLMVLGLPLERPQSGGSGMEKVMGVVISARAAARKEKQFSLADTIRDGLASAGIELLDRPEGTTWVAK